MADTPQANCSVPDLDAAGMDSGALLFHDAPLAVYLRGTDGALLDANMAMAVLFGFDGPAQFLEAMAATPDQYYLDPDTRASVLAALARDRHLTGRQFQALGRDGFVIWVEESARRIVSPAGETFYFGYLRDITAEKSSRWALTEIEEKYRAIFENAVEGLFQIPCWPRPSNWLIVPVNVLVDTNEARRPTWQDKRYPNFRRLWRLHKVDLFLSDWMSIKIVILLRYVGLMELSTPW